VNKPTGFGMNTLCRARTGLPSCTQFLSLLVAGVLSVPHGMVQ